MSLQPLRQTEQVNIDYITPWTQERGGCLTYAYASGMFFVEYAVDPSGLDPVGIQLNDVEYVNFSRQRFKQHLQTIAVPCDTVGICVQGDFMTDWVHLVGDVFNGDAAYVGPSGTFTNSSSFGGKPIGRFLGPLQADSHVVTMRGLGYTTQVIDPCTKLAVTENDPADRLLVVSPGYIKLRVDIGRRFR